MNPSEISWSSNPRWPVLIIPVPDWVSSELESSSQHGQSQNKVEKKSCSFKTAIGIQKREPPIWLRFIDLLTGPPKINLLATSLLNIVLFFRQQYPTKQPRVIFLHLPTGFTYEDSGNTECGLNKRNKFRISSGTEIKKDTSSTWNSRLPASPQKDITKKVLWATAWRISNHWYTAMKMDTWKLGFCQQDGQVMLREKWTKKIIFSR